MNGLLQHGIQFFEKFLSEVLEILEYPIKWTGLRVL
jgi:hypothetical protein